ncbi:fasciclin domain-containing protein [soil metagenome]
MRFNHHQWEQDNDSTKRLVTGVAVAAVAIIQNPSVVVAQQQNIVEVASGNDNFETLVQAVTAADLAGTLSGGGPFTVFAPVDAAFEKLPSGALNNLVADRAALRSVLTYHVVSGRLTAADLQGRDYVTTLNGERLRVRTVNGRVMVGSATVAMADVAASNGVIHAIDTVLMPPKPMRK